MMQKNDVQTSRMVELLTKAAKLPGFGQAVKGTGRCRTVAPDEFSRPGEERMSRRKWSLLIGLIGSVVFNVGWWISYPPMVFAGVLLAAAGLDLWIER